MKPVNNPFLSFFQILVRIRTAEKAKYHKDESHRCGLAAKHDYWGHNGEHHARARSQNHARSSPEPPPAKLDPRGAPEAQPGPGGSNPRAVPSGTHTQTGRGSAERRSRARPSWVTMEISRRAVASTTAPHSRIRPNFVNRSRIFAFFLCN